MTRGLDRVRSERGVSLFELMRELGGAAELVGSGVARVHGVHHDSRAVQPGDRLGAALRARQAHAFAGSGAILLAAPPAQGQHGGGEWAERRRGEAVSLQIGLAHHGRAPSGEEIGAVAAVLGAPGSREPTCS